MINAKSATGAKVKVSKEVVEAIEQLRKTMDDDRILYATTSPIIDLGIFKRKEKPAVLTLREILPMKLATSLVNGYEIEKTPEEEITAEWERLSGVWRMACRYNDCGDMRVADAKQSGIKFALDALGIKYKGVNA